MRLLIPILAAAVVGAGLTAAAIALPARASAREDRFDERLRAWEKCMQGQGFDVEGMTTIRVDDGRVTIDGEEVDPEGFRDAQRTCGQPFSLPPELEELPDLELIPKLPDVEPLPEVPEVPDPRLFPSPDELPELQELRDRLERLENCLRGELQEA